MLTIENKLCFILRVSNLIEWAYKRGYQPIGDEHLSILERQKKYHCKILSKITRSKSQRLAFDLDLSYKGKLITEEKEFKPLADHWKSLNHRNYSGKDCRKKPNHFEMILKQPRRIKKPVCEVNVNIQIK